MQAKLFFVIFNLNCGLHEVFVRNHLNKCQTFRWFGFKKPNPNWFSVFHTPPVNVGIVWYSRV